MTSTRERALVLAGGWKSDLETELDLLKITSQKARDLSAELMADLATVFLLELDGIDSYESRKVADARVLNLKSAGVTAGAAAARNVMRRGVDRLLGAVFTAIL